MVKVNNSWHVKVKKQKNTKFGEKQDLNYYVNLKDFKL